MSSDILRAVAVVGLLVGAAAPVASQGRPAPAEPQPDKPANAEARRSSSLDDLFRRLAAAKDAEEARGIAALIQRRFGRSGSDTADLLVSRAGEALKAKDAALAVELLDRVTQLRPDWAEVWNRRAIAFSILEDPVRAELDLEQALRREPRHFGAWMALGHLEMSSGDKRRALAAFRRALKIHPFLQGVQGMVDRLAPEIDGRDL